MNRIVATALDSLRARLLIGLFSIFGLGALAMLGLVRLEARGAHQAVEETSLGDQARQLLEGVRMGAGGKLASVDVPPVWRDAYRTPGAAYFALYDAAGHRVAQSANLRESLRPEALAANVAVGPLRVEGPREILTRTARAPDGYVLVVARSGPGSFEAINPDWVEDVAPTLVFCLAGGLGLLVAWSAVVISLRPLLRASREAASIGPEAPHHRLAETGLPSEVRPLVRAVNAGLDRVATAYLVEKHFTIDAAHALRTPLAVLSLRFQRARQGRLMDWDAVALDLAQLKGLISGLLNLSQAEFDVPRLKGRVNLARVAREVAAAALPRLEDQLREMDVIAPDDAPLGGANERAVRDALTILVDNAILHGAGQIRIEVEAVGPLSAVVRVSDEGGGVPEAKRDDVFLRFHKLDPNSAGAGLGLSIARLTARHHGGEACFVDATTVELRFFG